MIKAESVLLDDEYLGGFLSFTDDECDKMDDIRYIIDNDIERIYLYAIHTTFMPYIAVFIYNKQDDVITAYVNDRIWIFNSNKYKYLHEISLFATNFDNRKRNITQPLIAKHYQRLMFLIKEIKKYNDIISLFERGL